jgi:uncharacterized protein (UPF0276 family)
MSSPIPNLGLGIGWRPELALYIDRRDDLGFVEVLAENLDPRRPLPLALDELRRRGLKIIPHGVSLSLGGAEPLRQESIDRLARLAETCAAPLVSEHIAFVRAGGVEIGHLTPVPRTRASLDLLIRNVRAVQRVLPVPLALENIAAMFEWPQPEWDEGQFVRELLEATDALLLFDVSNLYANIRNVGAPEDAVLRSLPLDRLAYVHVGGGEEHDGVYHDSHAHPVPPGACDLLTHLCQIVEPPGVMLERDDDFPGPGPVAADLAAIANAVEQGRRLRQGGRHGGA